MGGLPAGGVALLSPPPFFEGQILISPEYLQILEAHPTTSGGPAASGVNAVQTNVDLLKSPVTIGKVVDNLGLLRRADMNALPPISVAVAWFEMSVQDLLRIAGLQLETEQQPDIAARRQALIMRIKETLRIYPEPNSRLLSASFVAPAPDVAADVVNDLFRYYIEDKLTSKTDLLFQVNASLARRADALKAELDRADDAIAKYRLQHDLLGIQKGVLYYVLLGSLQQQVTTAREELNKVQASYDASTRMLSGDNLSDAIPEALISKVIEQLRSKAVDLRPHLVLIIPRYNPENPVRVAGEFQLKEVQNQIQEEVRRIAASLATEVSNAKMRLARLQDIVTSTNAAANRLATVQIRLQQLVQDADAKRKLYQAFPNPVGQTQAGAADFIPAWIIAMAVPPWRQYGLSKAVTAALGVAFGMLFDAVWLVMRQFLRLLVGFANELEMIFGIGSAFSYPRCSTSNPSGKAIKMLRVLRIHIDRILPNQECKIILMTSLQIGEGKTTLATQFVLVTAMDGAKILLIDADFGWASVARLLRATRQKTLFEAVIRGDVHLRDAIFKEPLWDLHCVTASRGDPHSLARSRYYPALMEWGRRHYGYIVIDSPPLLRVADAMLLSKFSDTVFFVVNGEKTSQPMVAEALQRLHNYGHSAILSVLTKMPMSRLSPQDYFRGYGNPVVLGRSMGLSKAIVVDRQ